ncbi:SDR family oxidoreductase [Iningainema tapete]|uniref:SDR family oxidoreductase n=1 Tax=Iningainema tapete BLCC-T55 TaxID=2748662 RepID=A0A8J6XZI8_9CYAN|nr:SDR family oxidoreductase [Iningainema tapete]MBD2776128.1 SDR family oxidoreductase [Iningainema tapete BLCC-T55]
MQLKPINQQVVAVVGASSGIGRNAALQFANRGAKVVVAARSQQGLESLVEEIRSLGGDATAIVADVTDFNQVQAIANYSVEQYGRLDTWVHNAAVEIYAAFEVTTPEEFKRVIDVNLMGQVYGAKVALPHLKREGRGALIHVTSVEAKRSLPLQSAYAASKHAVDGFLESLRVELMHQKLPISVTQIMPAGINTPLFNKARTKLGVKPMPTPPIYDPSLVAKAIVEAAEHPKREVVVGDAGKIILLAQRISPGLVDAYMERSGFDSQYTKEPKSENAPDNLYEPLSGYDKIEGDFSDQSRSWSM